MDNTAQKRDGTSQSEFDVAAARSEFPALKSDQMFFDNAGGTQVLGTVINSYVIAHLPLGLIDPCIGTIWICANLLPE